MTCPVKPMASRWVAASAAGDQREAMTDSPWSARTTPAAAASQGAVKKIRRGRWMGGA